MISYRECDAGIARNSSRGEWLSDKPIEDDDKHSNDERMCRGETSSHLNSRNAD